MMVPSILLVHTLRWPNAARLALAFRKADCRVHALCRRRHPLRRLLSLDAKYTYRPFAPLRSLRIAIESADPHFVIPCDDPAVALINRLYSQSDGTTESDRRIRSVIGRSFGSAASYHLLAKRSNLTSIAALSGALLPKTDTVSTLGELKEWLGREGLPAVLKADHSWGGERVSIIRSLRDAELAFRRMTGLKNLGRTIKRLAWDQEPEAFFRLLRGLKPVLSVQSYIRGTPANCAVACWRGEVLASLEVEALAMQNPTGNASVVRVVDNADMIKVASAVVQRLGISGFCGFDFVVEENSGRAYLIEINPRATQINHLALGTRRDLIATLRARIAGEPVAKTPAITDYDIIALFPQEWQRDPESSFFLTAYHDVPRDEPALVRAYVRVPGRRWWSLSCRTGIPN
jgi:hypothetical protein